MRYYSYAHYSEEFEGVATISEVEIIKQYWDYWYDRMCQKYGKNHVDANYNAEDCLTDWITVNWAWESRG